MDQAICGYLRRFSSGTIPAFSHSHPEAALLTMSKPQANPDFIIADLARHEIHCLALHLSPVYSSSLTSASLG